jgi:hypothetical protein
VTYPPNPIRNLDDSLTPAEMNGRNFFFGPASDTFQDCDGCHKTLEGANPTSSAPGFFGTDGRSSFENETQVLKVPHLRNMYQKVGMFGMPVVPFFNPGNNGFQGDQIRGFGFLHDGSTDTLFRFHNATVFNQNPGFNATGITVDAAGDALRRDIEAFMMAFPSNMKPIVGQQITRTSTNGATVDPRIALLEAQADAGNCDLVAKGEIAGVERGWLYVGNGQFETDRSGEGFFSDSSLRALADTAGQEITFTCVPLGSGLRIGVDRDGDSYGDGDERDHGSDPSDAGSVPNGVSPVCQSVSDVVFRSANLTDRSGRLSVRVDLLLGTYTQENVSVTAGDSDGAIFTAGVAGNQVVLKGASFKYRAPRGATGITQVTLREKRNSGGIFAVTLKTKDAWVEGAADEDETTTRVTLNFGGKCFNGSAKHVH